MATPDGRTWLDNDSNQNAILPPLPQDTVVNNGWGGKVETGWTTSIPAA